MTTPVTGLESRRPHSASPLIRAFCARSLAPTHHRVTPASASHPPVHQRRRGTRFHAAVAAVIAVVMLLPVGTLAEEPVHGLVDSPDEPADLANWNPDVHPSPWFETWDFWMWADDGTFVFVQFVTSSFGFGIERKASGRMIVVEPGAVSDGSPADGVAFADRGWEWESGDWSWEETPLDLTFRDCHLRGDGETFEIRMRGRDHLATLEVTLHADEPLHRPGDGRLSYGWEQRTFYDQEALPRFRFEGRINRKERRDDPDDWQSLRGTGYGEHTLTNGQPHQVADAFHAFRALRPDGLSIVFDTVVVPPGFGARTLGWATVALDGQRLLESTEVVFAPSSSFTHEDGAARYVVPTAYEMEAHDGDNWVRVQFFDAELVASESPFARLSAFLRRVLGAMMAPYDFEQSGAYRAWVHIDGQTAFVTGRGWSTSNFTR